MSDDLVPVNVDNFSLIQDEELTKDYIFAKTNLQSIIYKGNEALDCLHEIALSSQQARAFEVYTALIKTLGDMNKQLLEASLVNQQIIEKKRHNNIQGEHGTINNTIVMTTADMIDMINKSRDEKLKEKKA